jgi:hypothetical protein
MIRLVLVGIDFESVHFTAYLPGGTRRPVKVVVGSGSSWAHAVRFPSIGTDATCSLGNDQFDALVRDRAGEELVRLGASRAA